MITVNNVSLDFSGQKLFPMSIFCSTLASATALSAPNGAGNLPF